LKFEDVAGVIAGPLARRKYVCGSDPQTIKLMIMVYWGSTKQSEFSWSYGYSGGWNNGPYQMYERLREMEDYKTANMLGYNSWWEQACSPPPFREYRRLDLLDELEDPRYFVVLMAYDFQLMRQSRHKLLWETRYSVRRRGVDFDQVLPSMTEHASRYFGQDSRGLVHRDFPGHVEVGEPVVLGVVP
jgi:hypothetical protein